MIKVNYPIDKQKRNSFENEYWKHFKSKENDYNTAVSNLSIDNFLRQYKLRDIVLGNIEKLVEIYEAYHNSSNEHKIEINDQILVIEKKRTKDGKTQTYHESLLKYEQTTICVFFEDHDHIFNLIACHYCNMDTVHVYSELDAFVDALDFLKKATIEQLKTIDNIGALKAEKIFKHTQKDKDSWSSSNLKGEVKTAYNSLVKNNIDKRDHFTLDHFIPQNECGLLAISLYNFVPSCYVCNCKLKGVKLLGDKAKISDLYKYSPTYDKFEKDGEIKFSLLLNDTIDIFDYHNNRAGLLKDVSLDIDTQGGNKALEVFRLKQRYAIHKDKAVRLAYLQERYSEQTLKEIGDILKVDTTIIKDDIFNLPTLENESFSKLQNDIALLLKIH